MDKGIQGTNVIVTCGKDDISLDPSWTKPVGWGESEKNGRKEKEKKEKVEREVLPTLYISR